MNRQKFKAFRKARRHRRVRGRILGTAERPRLSVFRSLKNVYAQVIDDVRGVTLAQASSVEMVRAGDLDGVKAGNREGAEAVGSVIAERAKEAGVTQVRFDRGGYKYHGRVAALADGARKGGLEF